MVDALFRHLVAAEAPRAPLAAGLAPASDAVVVLERLSAALASLADHAHGYTEVASMLRDIQTQVATLATAAPSPTPQRAAGVSARPPASNSRASLAGPHH
jgi:hypothetical protein